MNRPFADANEPLENIRALRAGVTILTSKPLFMPHPPRLGPTKCRRNPPQAALAMQPSPLTSARFWLARYGGNVSVKMPSLPYEI